MTPHDRVAIRATELVLAIALAACSPTSVSASSHRRISTTPPATSRFTTAAGQCARADLAVTFVGRQLGAGSDFGTFVIRDTSPAACRLTRNGTITPVVGKRAGGPIRFAFGRPLVLSPDAPVPRVGGNLPRQVVEAGLTVRGEYRDGPGPNGLCSRRHEVVPSRWLIDIGAVHLAIANGPHEPFHNLPDGARPYGGGGIQPVESCDSGFSIGFAGRWL
ncbi:MAG TPA: hypothetical protein VHD81_10005 [Mycobacteriales bacterium]|nr:hypothetical protein [Mycobacteriales bacterium]